MGKKEGGGSCTEVTKFVCTLTEEAQKFLSERSSKMFVKKEQVSVTKTQPVSCFQLTQQTLQQRITRRVKFKLQTSLDTDQCFIYYIKRLRLSDQLVTILIFGNVSRWIFVCATDVNTYLGFFPQTLKAKSAKQAGIM